VKQGDFQGCGLLNVFKLLPIEDLVDYVERARARSYKELTWFNVQNIMPYEQSYMNDCEDRFSLGEELLLLEMKGRI